jgi:hypothetical protein
MNKEFLHMQKLAGLITEGEYKAKMNENENISTIEDLESYLKSMFPNSKVMLKYDEEGDGVLIDGIYVSEGAYQKWDVYVEATDEEKSFQSTEELVGYLKSKLG